MTARKIKVSNQNVTTFTLIYDNYKAHCVYGRTSVPSYFTIGLGYWDRQQTNSWSVLKTVTRIIIHPSYDSSTTTNDIALMKLDVSYKFFVKI